MSETEYIEQGKLERFETLMGTKEILSREEYEFCKNWDESECDMALTYIGCDKWLNLLRYSPHEYEEVNLRMEQGI